ncbi:MAG: HlyD family secretion protein [Sphingobacterium sp.]|jgi:HlyD family secretion protein|nr:HlyD family secretion protein [Sphingobacterium sp.]
MAKKKSLITESDLHSADLQEIIAKPPSWLLRRGGTFILLTVLIIGGLSTFIRYPEMVNTSIKFNTADAPKVVSAKVGGNLVKLLAKDGTWITTGTPLAYLESTADHEQVLMLLERLQQLRQNGEQPYNLEKLIAPRDLNLGELQTSYQNFYLTYLNYLSSGDDGIYQKRRSTIHKEIVNAQEQYAKNSQSFELQKQQLELTEREFERYRILADKKVISPAELQEKETLLLAKRQTIPQMENNLISYQNSLLSKTRELTDIENQISEEQKKFIQALNSFISDAENWKRQYVMTSPSNGKLIYGEFLQSNQPVAQGQKLFYINPRNEQYYGEILLPQDASAKVKLGQSVLIKVRGYPYTEYGYLHGNIIYMSDIPIKDSVFFTKVDLIRSKQDSLIRLKPGVLGNAEIITEDKSIFKRIWDNLTKNLKFTT